MADPTWDETTPVDTATPTWENTTEVAEPPSQTKLGSTMTGVVNPLGTAPITGALGSTAMNAITGVSGPLAGGSVQDLIDEYNQKHDSLQREFAKSAAAHPGFNFAGKMAGMGAMGPAAMSAPGLVGTGAVAGGAEAYNSGGSPGDIAKGMLIGGGLNLAGGKVIEAAAPLVGQALNGVGSGLKGMAENLAEKATGATGKQAETFSPGTGRYLLDNGIVNFGSSPSNVAENAQNSMTQSGQNIQDILQNKLAGTKVSRSDVIKYIQDKIGSMTDNDAKDALVGKLNSSVENIESKLPELPIDTAEQIKRDYQHQVNWKSPDLENDANATVADAYRQTVEDAATKANPDLAGQFIADKQNYGMLKPVQQAADKRASTLNQSPIGGLLDVSSAGAGGLIGSAAGGPLGAVAGATAGYVSKLGRSRLASAGAVSADKLGDVLEAVPQAFGKYLAPLQQAAARGSVSLAVTNSLLQQTDPNYRAHLDAVLNSNSNDSGE